MSILQSARYGAMAIAAAVFLMGAAADDLGPPIEAAAPSIGTPSDQTGTPRTLASLMGDKGVVLFFFRSAEWCPFCQAQLVDLNGGVSAIEARGYHLAGISYDSPQVLANFTERRQIGYALLSDPKSEIIDRYGLRDPQYQPGSKAYGVPRPIVFVLDKNGLIKVKLYEETYRTRPPLSLILEKIDALSAAK